MSCLALLQAARQDIGAIWACYVYILGQIHCFRILRDGSVKPLGNVGIGLILSMTVGMVVLYCVLYGPTWTHSGTIKYPLAFFCFVLLSLILPAVILVSGLRAKEEGRSAVRRSKVEDSIKQMLLGDGGRAYAFVGATQRALYHGPLERPRKRLTWPLSLLQAHDIQYWVFEGGETVEDRTFARSQIDDAIKLFLNGLDSFEDVIILPERYE